jgi:dTDP-4-amino-4,6-dideoxygalactose transaminase
MLLKRAYLAGGPVRKALFRARFRHAEEEIAGVGGVAAPSWIADLLDLMPVSPWREIRRRNATALAAHLRALGLDVLISNDRNTVPFVVPVMLDNRRTAQRIRQGLARRKVYSPRLWDLDRPVVKPISAAGHNLSHRLLCLHCDHRYGAEDMRRVADILSELIVK